MASKRLWTPGTTIPPLQSATTPRLPGDSPQTSRGSLRSFETETVSGTGATEPFVRTGSVLSSDDETAREERESVVLGEALVFLQLGVNRLEEIDQIGTTEPGFPHCLQKYREEIGRLQNIIGALQRGPVTPAAIDMSPKSAIRILSGPSPAVRADVSPSSPIRRGGSGISGISSKFVAKMRELPYNVPKATVSDKYFVF